MTRWQLLRGASPLSPAYPYAQILAAMLVSGANPTFLSHRAG